MPRPLDRFRLVLVSPLYGGNVGAVARVAANFELGDLVAVKPLCDVRSKDAWVFAKGPAKDYLEKVRVVETLPEALGGCSAAVGFTRRQGGIRDASIEVGEVAALARDGRVALVFGREDSGLTNDELLQCTHVCSFAVGDMMPSLNLSHAVAVAVARVYEQIQSRPDQVGFRSDRDSDSDSESESRSDLAQVGDLEELFRHWSQALHDAGVTEGEERMMEHVRRALQRARLTQQELGIFRAYLSKTQKAMGTRQVVRKPKKDKAT